MVNRRHIGLLWLLCMLPMAGVAQNYSSNDTVTEYPNHGTYYHDMFVGRKTASGEVFDQNKFTAAHWRIKLGTYILVTNRNTGLQVIVRVNDRCPKRGVIDLSHRAATAIGIKGCQPVTVRILPEGYEKRWVAQESMFDSVAVRPAKSTPPAKEKQDNIDLPIFQPVPESTAGYQLILGMAASHSEAYEHISKLPENYRDKVLIEQPTDDDSITLILDINLSRQNAEVLKKGLKNLFPNARTEPRGK